MMNSKLLIKHSVKEQFTEIRRSQCWMGWELMGLKEWKENGWKHCFITGKVWEDVKAWFKNGDFSAIRWGYGINEGE